MSGRTPIFCSSAFSALVATWSGVNESADPHAAGPPQQGGRPGRRAGAPRGRWRATLSTPAARRTGSRAVIRADPSESRDRRGQDSPDTAGRRRAGPRAAAGLPIGAEHLERLDVGQRVEPAPARAPRDPPPWGAPQPQARHAAVREDVEPHPVCTPGHRAARTGAGCRAAGACGAAATTLAVRAGAGEPRRLAGRVADEPGGVELGEGDHALAARRTSTQSLPASRRRAVSQPSPIERAGAGDSCCGRP